MNKIIKACVVLFAVALPFISNSCDKFDTLPLNIPVSFKFIATSGNPTFDSGSYNLDSSKTYNDYKDDIEKLTFVEAAYRTKSVSSTSISVTLNVQVINALTSIPIINYTLNGFKPSDYISTPLILTFDQTQIQALNNYLVNNKIFRIVVTHSNMASGQTVEGAVDAVFEAEIKL
jgi:hypothetical protein